MKINLNHAQKRAASFVAAVLIVMCGSMFLEPARRAITSTLAAAALLGLPAVFVFLVACACGDAGAVNAKQQREDDHA